MSKSLQRNNKMFLTKEHFAKWFLILLLFLQGSLSEEPPGELSKEDHITESVESATNILLNLGTEDSLIEEITTESYAQPETQVSDNFGTEIDEILLTTASGFSDPTDESETTFRPIYEEEIAPGHKVNEETLNKFLRRLGLPAEELAFGAKITNSTPSSSVKKDLSIDEDISLKNLDVWRPVWPFSNNEDKFIPTRSLVNPIEVSPKYSIAKEPVTAYYFDLATPANSPAPGPLFDPTKLSSSLNSHTFSETEIPVRESHSSIYSVEPTPILPVPSETNQSNLPNKLSETVPPSSTPILKTIPVTGTIKYSIGSSSDFHFKNLTESHSEDGSKNIDFIGSSPDLETLTANLNKGDSLDLSSARTLFPSLPIVDNIDTGILPQIELTSTTIENTDIRKLNTRVPLWMRLSKKISPTIENSPLSTGFVHSTVSPTLVFSLFKENDLPLGILSAGLPVVTEVSSPVFFTTESDHFANSLIVSSTPSISVDLNSKSTISATNTLKINEDKTLLNNGFKVPLDGEAHPSNDPVANINSIPESKIKNVHNPMQLTPQKVNDPSTTPSLEYWKPITNDSTGSTATNPLSSTSLIPELTTTPSYQLHGSFTPITPITPILSISSSEVEEMTKLKTMTFSETPLFSAPSNSTLYIAEKVDFPSIKNATIVASKTTNSTYTYRPEAPLANVENDSIDPFVTVTEEEESLSGLSTENPESSLSLGDPSITTPPADVKKPELPFIKVTTESFGSITNDGIISNESETSSTEVIMNPNLDKSATTISPPPPTTTTTTTPSTTTSSSTIATSSSVVTTTSSTSNQPLEKKQPLDFEMTSEASILSEESSTEQNDLEMTTLRFEGNSNKEEKIIIVFEKPTGSEAKLHVVEMHDNGTKSTQQAPFVKAAVSYDIIEFCQHRKNIRDLLAEWLEQHLQSQASPGSYEIEIVYHPSCNNLSADEDLDHSKTNQTDLYFYVKKDGEISRNSTLDYPKDLSAYEISQELEYLREKITHLELVNAISKEDRILEEAAAVGTSIIVIIIVTIILMFLIVGIIFAVVVIRRRRSAESMHGRRCTPATNDAYSMDSVSVYYHSFKRKSRKRGSNKSIRSYVNQGFDDPNGPSRPLNFAKLTHFIADNEGIHKEYTNIPSVLPNYDEMPRGCEEKNRYANVIPVPETRIFLKSNKNTPCAEYINANFVHGPRGELRYYIATQAPLDETVCDFWQMVWEQESRVIVMLTDLIEKEVDKCADYLPPSETLDCHRVYGDFQVTLKSRDMRDKYIASYVQLKNLENNLVREICHMWYTGWPHSGVPNEESPFISFIFDIRTTRKKLRSKGPIVVHCSPGTGRTGTYIACDISMKQFDDQKTVDIPKVVYKIRRERAGAVQTKEQYAFIYRVVNLYAAKLTTGNLDSF